MHKRKFRKKIYQTQNLYIYQNAFGTFSIEGVISGKRYRKTFKSLKEAQICCHQYEEQRSHEFICRTILSKKQLIEAEHCFQLIPKDISLNSIVEEYLNRERYRSCSIEQVTLKFLQTKESNSPHTYRQFKRILFIFIKYIGDKYLDEVSAEDALLFLNSQTEGSFNPYLRICKGLYIWAVKNSYAQSNPFCHISIKSMNRGDVSVLSVREITKLICLAKSFKNGVLLPYVSLCVFAGLRPDSEMRHLDWNQINLHEGEIRIVKGKTNTPRVVDLPENLITILGMCNQSLPIYPKNFRRLWAELRAMSGFKSGIAGRQKIERKLKTWVKDIMRHSAISYRVRFTKNIFETATWAGTSPQVIKKHYLGLVSSREAGEFFSIT